MTHQKILNLMAGSSSAKPMPFDTLVEKSGLLPDTLRNVLDQMANSMPASICRATITRGSNTSEVYWPTGMVVLNRGPQGIVVNPLNSLHRQPPQRPELTAAKVQPNTAKTEQENAMNTRGSKPSQINQAIYDKIVEHPGIGEQALIKHVLNVVLNADLKKVKKTIGNMRSVTKKIRAEGERGDYRYHLNTEPRQPCTRKARVGKVVTGPDAAELRGDKGPTSVPTAPAGNVVSDTKDPEMKRAAYPAEESFSLMLSDTYFLHISIGDEMICLNPAQLRRLDQFLGSVLPDGVRA